MAKIIAPNKQYSGISASVTFVNGIGETDNPNLIDWFKNHGYEVELDEADQDNGGSEFDNMTAEELKAYAEEKGIDIGNATSQKGILKKILEAEKGTE